LTPDFVEIVVLSVDRLRFVVLRDNSIELDDDATDDDELLKSPCC
jgi:hypothetical protein